MFAVCFRDPGSSRASRVCVCVSVVADTDLCFTLPAPSPRWRSCPQTFLEQVDLCPDPELVLRMAAGREATVHPWRTKAFLPHALIICHVCKFSPKSSVCPAQVDLCSDPELVRQVAAGRAATVCISALTGDGLDKLASELELQLAKQMSHQRVLIPYDMGEVRETVL